MRSTSDLYSPSRASPSHLTVRPSLIIVVEGSHDLQFLLHTSRALHTADASVPDLGQLADRGEILLLPVGGSPLAMWSVRLAALRLAEFHVYDQETEPETQ